MIEVVIPAEDWKDIPGFYMEPHAVSVCKNAGIPVGDNLLGKPMTGKLEVTQDYTKQEMVIRWTETN